MESFATAIVMFVWILILACIIVYIVSCLGQFALFRKAGRSGWKAFIPFLNTYTLCELANAKEFFIWSLIISFGSPIVTNFANSLGSDILSSIVNLAVTCFTIYVYAVLYRRLADCFGFDGWAWTILILLFPFIMFLIIGFGSSQYTEPAYALKLFEKKSEFL